jgi:2-oxoglutarate ferredoxin oxidoreductase subunit alpha
MKNKQHTLSIAITGSGGSGVVTMGLLFLKAISAAGYYALMTRSSGPQIRGGESAVMLRVGTKPVHCQDDCFHLLLALDWFNFSRFADEIPLTSKSVVLYDPAAGDLPTVVIDSAAQLQEISLTALAKTIEGGRPNMLGLGLLAALLGIDKEATERAVNSVLGRKGVEVVATSMKGINVGFDTAPSIEKSISNLPRLPPAPAAASHWNISGNEAAGLGALRGGVRLVAAYPITPATEILEWLAPNLEKVGGALIQAEDELAAINMVIGASFGGVPALTATSGPGLSLMSEALGLAVASETPLVVVNVTRGGPSTGIPTKSEQSDLNIAIYGMHGDAPHLVLAPKGIDDCAFTTDWAVRLAERLQTVAIVLSDQSLGQSRAIVDPPQHAPVLKTRATVTAAQENYERYALTADGISQMAIPGTAGCIYTADGLEHSPEGLPSSTARDHSQQLEKRYSKLTRFDYGVHWAVQEGEGNVCLVTWGSSSGVVEEAAHRLRAAGMAIQTLAIRLLSPLPTDLFQAALQGIKRIVVVEQNQHGQLFHYLNSMSLLPEGSRVLAHSGPLPIRPAEVVTSIKQWCSDE